MKLSTVPLFILAGALGALALRIRPTPAPPGLASACPSALEITSSTITINGQEILRQEFSCPDGNITTPAISEINAIPPSAFSKRTDMVARNQAECTTPAAECQCGAAIICGCYGETSGPSASDCSALLASLPVIASITGPTFIVQPMTVHTTSLRTCAVSFINIGSTAEEYCWDDLASTGNGEMSCMSSPPFSDAVCMAQTQRFEIHLGVTA